MTLRRKIIQQNVYLIYYTRNKIANHFKIKNKEIERPRKIESNIGGVVFYHIKEINNL